MDPVQLQLSLAQLIVITVFCAMLVFALKLYVNRGARKAPAAVTPKETQTMSSMDAIRLEGNIMKEVDKQCGERREALKQLVKSDIETIQARLVGNLELVAEKFTNSEKQYTQVLERLQQGDKDMRALRGSIHSIETSMATIARNGGGKSGA